MSPSQKNSARRKTIKLMVASGNTAIALQICNMSRLRLIRKCDSYC